MNNNNNNRLRKSPIKETFFIFLLTICWGGTAMAASLYTVVDIGPIGSAFAINASGQVVGQLRLGSYNRAFLYSGGAMRDLGTLGGNSYGYGINNMGQVVGASNAHGFLYTDGQMIDLNTLLYASPGWTITEARGINEAGQIVGTAIKAGTGHAVLLNPVPIPGAFWLFGSAMVALLGFDGNRNRPRK